MKNIKEFPFELSRRISVKEVRSAKKAIEKVTGTKRKLRVGRPHKLSAEKYIAVSIRLHPDIIKWAKKKAKDFHTGYQTLINNILLENIASR